MVTNSPTPKSVMSIASAIEGVNDFIHMLKVANVGISRCATFLCIYLQNGI